ncbi:MAG: hypothetical protein ACRD82_19230 [Blastocatellia bacterium]
MNSFDSFTLTPMSAGDVIDRAVRIYRRNFLALLRIVFGPSLIAYVGTVLYYLGVRNFSMDRGDSRVVVSVALMVGGSVIWMIGKAAFYAVLGGASRSLVDHFFEGKPILARDVYRAVRERFWSLIGAMFMVGLLLMGAGTIVYFLAIVSAMIGIAGTALLSGAPVWLKTTLAVGFAVVIAASVFMIFLLIYSRVVYVPQVMMVEGKTVFSSISRSFSLASGELWRIAALLLFWFYVAWSVWSLLFTPLGSAAYWLGVDPSPFNQAIPFWFNIANQTVTQVSEIIIAPITMVGFTLLYLDSRVRKEGFDIELMANRLLPATPEMIQQSSQPQTVFFSEPAAVATTSFVPSILGLSDYRPIHPSPIEQATPPETSNVEQVAESYADAFPEFVPEVVVEQITAEAIETLPAEPAEPVTELPKETPAASAQRLCHWCGTAAGNEDRFCRVCGSVF